MPVKPGIVDKDGNAMKEGEVYLWGDGTQARLHNGAFEPVKIPNPASVKK